jgi:hypothetical protein
MELTPLFANFLAVDMLDLDNESIIKTIKEKERTADNRSVFFDGTESSIKPLLHETSMRINGLHERFNMNEDLYHDFYKAWANVGPNQYTTAPHHHVENSDTVFCAVYYPLAEQEGCPLVFMNPNIGHTAVFRDGVYSNKKPQSIYTAPFWRIQPKTGMLVIFPSWLQHFVAVEDDIEVDREKRISIALNTRFYPK